MPPAKSRPAQEDSRSDASNARDRQIAAAAHARKSKNGASTHQNGSALKALALVSTELGTAITSGQGVSTNPAHPLEPATHIYT